MVPLDTNLISRPINEKGGPFPELIVTPAQAGLAIRALYEEFSGNATSLPQDEKTLSQESLKKTVLENPIIRFDDNILLFHAEPTKDKVELKYILGKQAVPEIEGKDDEGLVTVARNGGNEKEAELYFIRPDGVFLRLKEKGFEEENDLEKAKNILSELETIQEKQSSARVTASVL